jgi:hypothetical protein
MKSAVTPRPVKQLSRAVYTVTNPLGAVENKLIGAALNGGKSRRSSGGSRRSSGQPASRATSRVTTGSVRAVEAAASHQRLAELMAVQRERFTESRRPIVAAPAPVDPAPFRDAEWARRKGEVRFWQRSRRLQLRTEAEKFAQDQAARAFARLQAVQQEQQRNADAWWNALNSGEPQVVAAALAAAFADNPASVRIVTAGGVAATLVVILPGPQVLPAKKAHVTPTGRLSSKAWTKTEFQEVYAELLGAHLLATLRETWAVCPSLTQVRVIGIRWEAGSVVEVLFDVNAARNEGQWADDSWGSVVLQHASSGLNRGGRTREVQPWPQDGLRPDVARLLEGVLPTAG